MSRSRVQVCIRTRPTSNFATKSLTVDPASKSVAIHLKKAEEGAVNNKQENWAFGFNQILHNSSQKDVYDRCASDVVDDVLQGYNGTIMAYGQTGAGKTFTMIGSNEFKDRGIAPRAIAHVFRSIEDRSAYSVTVRVSYLEVYMEQFFDLLDEKGAQLHDLAVHDDERGNVVVRGLKRIVVQDEEEALALLFRGEQNRATAAHAMNQNSSRSHCIFSIMVEQRSRVESSAKVITSKLNLVDLAGSERVGKTGSTGLTLKEAQFINKSLTFLEQTVKALADKNRDHVPFRQSKLTNVLRDSIAGNCKTRLIANIYCEREQLDETISTLKFATRMMRIVNVAEINVSMDPVQLVQKYRREIQGLKQELAMHDTLANRGNVNYDAFTPEETAEIATTVQQYVRGDILDIDVVNIRQIKEVFKQFKNHILDLESQMRQQAVSRRASVNTSTAAPSDGKKSGGGGVSANNSNVQYVGEIDEVASGFNVGAVDPSSRPTTLASPTRPSYPSMSASNSQANSAAQLPYIAESNETKRVLNMNEMDETAMSSSTSAPSKSAAFSEFKLVEGMQLQEDVTFAKDALREKQKLLKQSTDGVNELAKRINVLQGDIARKTQVRLRDHTMKRNNVEVIDEEEFTLLQTLKQNKKEHANAMANRTLLVTQVEQAKSKVAENKAALMNGFLTWYGEKYGAGPSEGGYENEKQQYENKDTHGDGDELDDGEKFEQLEIQRIMNSHPESLSFYNAKKAMNSSMRNTKRLKNARKPLNSSIRPRMK